MMETVHIIVSEEDIKRGIRASTAHCPIALACRRTFSVSSAEVSIRFNRAKIGNIIENQQYRLPTEAILFIQQFDMRLPVKPFEFDMSLIMDHN